LEWYFKQDYVEDIKLTRRSYIVSLPYILILYVKRYDAFGNRKDNKVIFPMIELDMLPFLDVNNMFE
jgi:uncharacterized UBP type Zn finger protein